MWHRFPQPMRSLILRALEEAARQGRAAADPADFLAAIPLIPECSAAHILTLVGATPASPSVVTSPAAAISPESKKLFEQAYEESAQLNDRVVGTDHLLLAMCRSKICH